MLINVKVVLSVLEPNVGALNKQPGGVKQVGAKGGERNWRRLMAQRRWEEINWLQLPFEEQKNLLAAVRAILPKKTVENGMEINQRYVTPAEAPVEMRGAAALLTLGELEAAVEGDPPPAAERWDTMREDVERVLDELAAAPELTKGDRELSRQNHAREALSYLQQIEFAHAVARGQVPSEEREWLYDLVAEVAEGAFLAGRHTQAALGKGVERSAVRGEKVAGGARNSAHATNKKHEPIRRRRLARMAELVPDIGVEAAAAQCESEGLGSWQAVKQTWHRWKEIV